MSPPRVLFADDDHITRQVIQTALENAEMEVFLAQDGATALELWRTRPFDIAILDVMMPEIDGFAVCRTIRENSDLPIMILTAMGREEDILRGFDCGADDYLTKPFRHKELIARVQAILQRMQRLALPPESQLTYTDLTLDLAAQRLVRAGVNLPITTLEFQLLRYLMQRSGTVISKEDLFQNVWGYMMPAGGMNLIEVAVRRLRGKIEADPARPRYIQTVRGAGYRLGE